MIHLEIGVSLTNSLKLKIKSDGGTVLSLSVNSLDNDSEAVGYFEEDSSEWLTF